MDESDQPITIEQARKRIGIRPLKNRIILTNPDGDSWIPGGATQCVFIEKGTLHAKLYEALAGKPPE